MVRVRRSHTKTRSALWAKLDAAEHQRRKSGKLGCVMDDRGARHTFSMLTDAGDIEQAEGNLRDAFEAVATWSEARTFGTRAGQAQLPTRFVKEHDLWFATGDGDEWWTNAFGIGEPPADGQTALGVLINVPDEGVNRRMGGAFLRDEAGQVYLAHSGKVGGGRKGIGKEAFLHHNSNPTVSVGPHKYVLVGCLSDDEFIADVARFVRSVRAFKAEATSETEAEGEDVRYPEDLYWLFQANPKQFNLVEDLARQQPGDTGTWVVTRYAGWMAAGARVLLWQGGPDAGIYAVGTLTGEPEEQHGSNPYGGGERKRKWSEVPFRYDAIFSKPLLKSELKQDEVLAELSVIKGIRSTNRVVTACAV